MSDDVFDQLVDDILSGEDDDDELESTDDDDDVGAEPALVEDDSVINSDSEINTDGTSAVEEDDDEPDPAPAAAPVASESPGDSNVARSTPSESKKSSGKGASLPLATSTTFDHPQYVVGQTLSMISTQRVVGTSGLEAGEGRSADGEQLLATVEQELKTELRQLAAARGCHAVIGVEISLASANGLLFAQARGTPIRLRKRDK